MYLLILMEYVKALKASGIVNIKPIIDGNGYSVKDLNIKYTIEPPDYNASTAYVALTKKDDLNNEAIIAFIPSERTGAGEVTLSEGFQFNINSTYEAQVILNYGTGVEMRSERIMLPFVEIKVMDDDPENTEEVEEIKFGDGSRKKKRYYIELVSKDLAELKGLCESLTGSIKVVDKELKQLELDESVENNYYPTVYPLSFLFDETKNKCSIKFRDGNAAKEKFIVSNMSKGALFIRLLELLEVYDITVDLNDISVLYGGLGNSIEVEIGGIKKVVPIEPLGVIVLAIDGLRQDVLYPDKLDGNDFENVNDTQGNYYVDASTLLPGLRQILKGDPKVSSTQQYIMLPEVASIFPSITLASWASIFTGRMPGPADDVIDGEGNVIVPRGTGILGNEFFARDRSLSVPARFNNPSGIISFSSGAFKGFDAFPKPPEIDLLWYDFFVPYQLNWEDPITPEDTPQNYTEILKPDTVFQNINEIQGVKDYFNEKGGDPVVVANLQYARGAYWLTWDISPAGNISELFDKGSWDKFTDYLCGRYMDGILNDVFSCFAGKRNNIPFSALTVWYLAGLDHEAHVKGMSEYSNYFINKTDKYINRVVNTLKELDEFGNKIFIITSDHGHTAMPELGKITLYPGTPDERVVTPDICCGLKLEGFNKRKVQDAEKANNNLHIWELGEVLRALQEKKTDLNYRVLAPSEIAELFIDTPAGARRNLNVEVGLPDFANVVVAFNGPMAHIYLRSQDGWQSQPNLEELKRLAEVLRVLYQIDDFSEGEAALGLDMIDYLNLLENKVGRLKQSVDKILIRKSGEYLQFDGYGTDGFVLNQLSFSSEYIKALERIDGMNNLDRSGDIVLLFKNFTDDIAENRYSSGVSYKSWHGSLNPSDSYVPFIVTYPGGNKYEIEPIINNTEGCSTDSGCDGNWRVTDLIKTIINIQYKE